jgi:hypothetical protein
MNREQAHGALRLKTRWGVVAICAVFVLFGVYEVINLVTSQSLDAFQILRTVFSVLFAAMVLASIVIVGRRDELGGKTLMYTRRGDEIEIVVQRRGEALDVHRFDHSRVVGASLAGGAGTRSLEIALGDSVVDPQLETISIQYVDLFFKASALDIEEMMRTLGLDEKLL